jgi:hypothetical protein
MLRRPPPDHVDKVRSRLECAHHTRCGLMEHPVGNIVEQMTLELKVNDQVNARLFPDWSEGPGVCQVL